MMVGTLTNATLPETSAKPRLRFPPAKHYRTLEEATARRRLNSLHRGTQLPSHNAARGSSHTRFA